MKLRSFCEKMRVAQGTLRELSFHLLTTSLSLKQLDRHRQQYAHDESQLLICVMQCEKHTVKINYSPAKHRFRCTALPSRQGPQDLQRIPPARTPGRRYKVSEANATKEVWIDDGDERKRAERLQRDWWSWAKTEGRVKPVRRPTLEENGEA